MERKSKILMGLVGATLVAAGLLSSAEGGKRQPLTVDSATRALVYGQADATWTTRAAELVARDPDAAGALAHVAEATNVDSLTRMRAFDALAASGSPRARAAMRQALTSPTLRADAAYPMLVARLFFAEKSGR